MAIGQRSNIYQMNESEFRAFVLERSKRDFDFLKDYREVDEAFEKVLKYNFETVLLWARFSDHESRFKTEQTGENASL